MESRNDIMKKCDYITAGAYYRLSKRVLIKACEQISCSLRLPKVESRKMYCLYDKWIDLDAKIGFEDMAYRDEIAKGRNISFYDHCPELVSLFFGDLSINSETDKKITDKIEIVDNTAVFDAYYKMIDKIIYSMEIHIASDIDVGNKMIYNHQINELIRRLEKCLKK